jgi:hypothetical protein
MTQVINTEVAVSSFYFADPSGRKPFPRRIEWNGQLINFANEGLRYLVEQGGQLVQLFDMTDGDNTYRLREQGDHWTLVGVSGAGVAGAAV